MGSNAFGQSLARKEDTRLLTGAGRFTADLIRPGMAHAIMLRSPHAHADIVSIDASAALAMPGVLAVLTGQDYVQYNIVTSGIAPFNFYVASETATGLTTDPSLDPTHWTAWVQPATNSASATVRTCGRRRLTVR